MANRSHESVEAAASCAAAASCDPATPLLEEAIEAVGHWTIEFDTGVVTWSPAMFDILELDPARTTPSEQLIVERTHPEDRASLRLRLEAVIATRGPTLLRHRIITPKGIRHVEFIGATELDGAGRIHCAWGTLRDITDRVVREARLQDSVVNYEALIEQARDSVLVIDMAGRIVEANEAYAARSGYSQQELMGRPVWELDAGFDEAGTYEQIRLIKTSGALQFQTEAVDVRGQRWPVEVLASYSPREGGRIFSLLRDLSALREAERSMEASARRFEALLHTTRDGLLVLDRAGYVVEANEAYARLSGYAQSALLGRHISELDAHSTEAEARERCQEIIRQGSTLFVREHRRADGSIWPVEVSASFAEVEGGRMFSLFRDISERRRAEEHLNFLAFNDALTGLPNRRLLSDRLEQAICLARRNDSSVAVSYLDLDSFKSINDQFGHDAGDDLLLQLAARLRAVLREGDTVARLGGDEFVVLMVGLSGQEEVAEVAGRILATIARPFDIAGQRLYLTASIGITLYPDDDEDPETLLRHADHALYQAKDSGRGVCRFFDRVTEGRASQQKAALRRIEEGLVGGEFCLHFQPRVNLRTGEVVAVEALLRWDHPERGLLGPAEFLPTIAGSSLELAVDEWVFERALDERRELAASGLPLAVSVNVSSRYIQEPHFPGFLAALLSRFPDDTARYLEIEVLETSALGSTERVASIMEACRALGVAFSLDDFGTGYSSLTYFHRLPISVLKIDQNFVRNMLDHSGDRAIIDGILRMASATGKPVVAEGVETEDIAQALLELGCELAQGYGIARPMPAERLREWMQGRGDRFP